MAPRGKCPKCGSTDLQLFSTPQGATARCNNCGAQLQVRGTVSRPLMKAAPSPADTAATPSDRHSSRKSLAELETEVPLVWKPGDIILGLYEVLKVHGGGGMGLVYKVRHRTWNVDLAVKTPRREFIERIGGSAAFKREAETWANLGLHPHIVSCYYVRELGGVPRVFAEYVSGGSLSDWIKTKRLYEGSPDQALARILDISIQFAWGLHCAHEQALINQDVKPANVMMTPEGTAKVTDFGLVGAKAQAGTPAYCSPEQAEAGAMRQAGVPTEEIPPLTLTTDIWSWGVSVMEMFLGEMTWASGVLAPALLEAYEEGSPRDPSLPAMPPALRELLRQCFRFEPQDRPGSIKDVADRLEDIYRTSLSRPYHRRAPGTVRDTADSLNNRAVSMLDLGRPEDAEKLWEHALRVEPHHPQSSYNRGLILWRSARLTDLGLVETVEQMRKAHEDNWIGAQLLTMVHMERGDFSEAANTLRKLPWFSNVKEIRLLSLEMKMRLSENSKPPTIADKHKAVVNSVCLSNDARFALSGSRDQKAKFWELSTGRCEKTFVGHDHAVDAVRFTRDGNHALVGAGNTLKLLEVATGFKVREFKGHREPVLTVDLSKDGQIALSRSLYEVKIWDVSTARCLRTLEEAFGQSVLIGAACLSSDGRRALSARGEVLRLWDVNGGACTATFRNPGGNVTALGLTGDGLYALAGSDSDTLTLLDLSSGKVLRTFRGSGGTVECVVVSPDGRFAFSTDGTSAVKVWEVATGRCLRTIEDHPDAVKSLAVGPTGKQVLAGCADGSIKLSLIDLDASVPAPLVLSKVVSSESAVTVQSDFERAMTEAAAHLTNGDLCSAAGSVREARSQPGYNRHPQAVRAWTSLYLRLPRSKLSGTWVSAEIKTPEKPGPLYLSPDGRFALSGKERVLTIWDLDTQRAVRTIEDDGELRCAFLGNDARYVISGSGGNLKLREVSSGRLMRVFSDECELTAVCLSYDNRFAVSAHGKTLKIWDVATSSVLRIMEGHTSDVTSLSLSRDGRYVVSGSADTTVRLWVLATGRCIRTFQGHLDKVASVWLNLETGQVLSGSKSQLEGELRLWDVRSGECSRSFNDHRGRVLSVMLGLDGKYALAAGGGDNSMKLLETATGYSLHVFEGPPAVMVSLSLDGRYAVSADSQGQITRWSLDWELEDHVTAEWDQGAQPFLEAFLAQQTPFAEPLSSRGPHTQEQIHRALTRRGKPTWTNDDFKRLLHTLGCAGFGWLQPQGIARKLLDMASRWDRPPALL